MQDDDLAAIMRALAHPVRLQIVRLLARNADRCCCMDLAQALPLAQSTVSQHIKVLLDAGLIARRPEGTRNCYLARPETFAAAGLAFGALVSSLTAWPALPPQLALEAKGPPAGGAAAAPVRSRQGEPA